MHGLSYPVLSVLRSRHCCGFHSGFALLSLTRDRMAPKSYTVGWAMGGPDEWRTTVLTWLLRKCCPSLPVTPGTPILPVSEQLTWDQLQCAGDAGQESPVEDDHLQKCLQLLDERGMTKLLNGSHMGGKGSWPAADVL
jgi:hypothetical protein